MARQSTKSEVKQVHCPDCGSHEVETRQTHVPGAQTIGTRRLIWYYVLGTAVVEVGAYVLFVSADVPVSSRLLAFGLVALTGLAGVLDAVYSDVHGRVDRHYCRDCGHTWVE